MKLLLSFLSLLWIPLFLAGCWDRIEVNDMALIISAGIDKSADDQLELTVQVFIPNPTGSGTSNGGGDGNVYTISSKGSSMPDALTELQKKLPRYFSWDHTKAYFFGEALGRRGLSEEFDFLYRDIQPREQSNFFICKGTARKLLESQNDPNTYETLIKLAQKPTTHYSTMHLVEEKSSGESGAFILPVASLDMSIANQAQKTFLTVEGMAIIYKKKLIGYLDREAEMGIRLMHPAELGRNVTLTRKVEGGKVVIRVVDTDTKLLPSIENGIWRMKVKLSVNADVIQNTSQLTIGRGFNNMRKLEEPFNEEVKNILVDTIRRLQQVNKADVIGFANAFHKKYPQQWSQIKNDWSSKFPTIDVQVDTDLTIHKPGISNIPNRAHLQKE
ncbi:Ger(x)C family spore germination protein [Paenibacillus rigui]|nr:Ger(x)C family spore germination protein [Paenibacillus rigui]